MVRALAQAGLAVRVLVLGARGMLGHTLARTLAREHEVWATVRAAPREGARELGVGADRLLGGVDAERLDSVARAVTAAAPEVVVNCIGMIKQRVSDRNVVATIRTNALFPHQLAELCAPTGARLIHLSTDCVFSGTKGAYTEQDEPDATDLYGRSKLLGEPTGERCVTIRTSMIGRELDSAYGLVEWFLRVRTPSVQGFRGAIFSGLGTTELSRVIARIISASAPLTGLYHVSGPPISKYDLLLLLKGAFGSTVDVVGVDERRVDRSLDSGRFRREFGYEPPSWERMVGELAAEVAPAGS